MSEELQLTLWVIVALGCFLYVMIDLGTAIREWRRWK